MVKVYVLKKKLKNKKNNAPLYTWLGRSVVRLDRWCIVWKCCWRCAYILSIFLYVLHVYLYAYHRYVYNIRLPFSYSENSSLQLYNAIIHSCKLNKRNFNFCILHYYPAHRRFVMVYGKELAFMLKIKADKSGLSRLLRISFEFKRVRNSVLFFLR